MAKVRHKQLLHHSASRLIAATLGTLPVALCLGLGLALTLPLPISWGLRVGSCALLPIWAATACCAFLADDAREVWALLIGLSALAAFLSCSVLLLEHGLVLRPTDWLAAY